MCLGAERQDDTPNTFAPEGASRCRALTSGLKGRSAGRKERLSEKWRDLQCRSPTSQGKGRKTCVTVPIQAAAESYCCCDCNTCSIWVSAQIRRLSTVADRVAPSGVIEY